MKIPLLSTFIDSTLIGWGVGDTGEDRVAGGFLTDLSVIVLIMSY
jgi:hypothetical protein